MKSPSRNIRAMPVGANDELLTAVTVTRPISRSGPNQRDAGRVLQRSSTGPGTDWRTSRDIISSTMGTVGCLRPRKNSPLIFQATTRMASVPGRGTRADMRGPRNAEACFEARARMRYQRHQTVRRRPTRTSI